MERYFVEPYAFVPPFRSQFWPSVLNRLVTRAIRRDLLIPRWTFRGAEHIRKAKADGAGLVLACNHSRLADTFLLGQYSTEARQYFYYMASYHLFRESRFKRWLINRLGAFSVFREGVDREALREAAAILAAAERPLVIYPEGTWFRRNDGLGTLQDGLGLICRQAIQKGGRPVRVAPVIIKYWFLGDPLPAIRARLAKLETALGWRPLDDLPPTARLDRLTAAHLALKEIEYRGEVRCGTLNERLSKFVEESLARLEPLHFNHPKTGEPLERIRGLRQALVKELHAVGADRATEARLRQELHELLLGEMLLSQEPDYHHEDPSPERLGEALQRLEELLTDSEKPVAPMGALIEVGEPFEAGDLALRKGSRSESDPVVRALDTRMRDLLARIRQEGPPKEWGTPRR